MARVSSSERQKKFREVRRSLGLVKVEVWVPEYGRKLIRDLEHELTSKILNTKSKGQQNMTKFTADSLYKELLETEESKSSEVEFTLIEGDNPLIQATVQDVEEFPVNISVGQEQILAIVNLFKSNEIEEGKAAALSELLLRANLPVPLSAFSIVHDQYVLFGALSLNSNVSEVLEEVLTLSNNTVEALELCKEYLKR